MFRLTRVLSPSSYQRGWLARDIVARIVLSTLLVPQGMAYAELAGLKAWLCRIMINAFISGYRKNRAQPQLATGDVLGAELLCA